MIVPLSLITLAVLVVALLLQVVWAWRLAALFARRPAAPAREGELPRVAVILAVRGADPSLAGCLEGVLRQNYPCYDVRVVVDSRADPAWGVVRRAVEAGHGAEVRVSLLEVPRPTCSLKLSALVQALGGLEASYGAVALIDADVVPHPDWLRDLVAPLSDPRVGAATGLRWFAPAGTGWGTLVRYLWGAAACTQMYAFHIPWGGSLALRADLVRGPVLLEQWQRSLWEDTACYRALRDAGLRLRFVPAATMVNRETTDLRSCFQFIRRQMLNVRLYHPSWPAVLAHGAATGGALAAAAGLFAAALAAGCWGAAACTGGGLAAYALGACLALALVERGVRRLARRRGEEVGRPPRKALLALPAAHLVYLACLASAGLLRRVAWRGVTYEFRGPWDVRMVAYCPYEPAGEAGERSASLV